MLVKVCGMREADNIREVMGLGIDMIGFIFYPGSPRFVERISPPRTCIVSDYGGERPKRVGVFVGEMPQAIIVRICNYDLDCVQLHGNESGEMIDNLRRCASTDIRPGLKIIKALSVSGKADMGRWREYEGLADMLLFDRRCDSVGGSGVQFDWSILDAYDGDIPFLLSGGIGPEDAERIRQIDHPMFAGIDLNSRFETEPGVKDVEKLRTFINKVRKKNGSTRMTRRYKKQKFFS